MVSSFVLFKVPHVAGFILWVGAAFGLVGVLIAHGSAPREQWPLLVGIERSTGRAMDVGATLALIGGIGMLVVSKKFGDAWALKQGWMHAKLLLIVMLLGVHGFLRAKAGRFARENVSQIGSWPYAVVMLLGLGIICLAVLRPF